MRVALALCLLVSCLLYSSHARQLLRITQSAQQELPTRSASVTQTQRASFSHKFSRSLLEQPAEAAQERVIDEYSTAAGATDASMATTQQPPSKSRSSKLRAPPVKRTAFTGPRGVKPLAVSARTGGARTLMARGFSLKSRSSGLKARMTAQTASEPAVAASTIIGKLTTPAGTLIIDPPVEQPAPGWPGTIYAWPDGSSATTSMQANGDVITDIWFPVGVTAVAFYAVGQSGALNTCSVVISISAYSYEAPATPSTLTQTVNSCSDNGKDFAAFFGFAVQDADADDLVRLEIRVMTGVAPTEEDPIPTAGVIFSEFMLSTSRPLNPNALSGNQDDRYLADVLGFDSMVPAQTPTGLGASLRGLETAVGSLTFNRPATVVAAHAAWPGEERTVLSTNATATFSMLMPRGTTAVILQAGVLDPCLAGGQVRLRVRAHTSIAPTQSNSVKQEDFFSRPEACAGGVAATRLAGFYVDGSISKDTINRVEITVWTDGKVPLSALQLLVSDIQVTQEQQATGDVMRLTPPSGTHSRVEVLRQGRWGTICATGLSRSAANLICRQKGFHGGFPVVVAQELETAPIWLNNVNCKGSEASLGNCSYTVLGQEDLPWECSHSQAAGVECHTDDLMSFADEGYTHTFLDEALGFNMNQAAIPSPGSTSNAIATPSGPISSTLPLSSGALPAGFQFPDGSSKLLQLKQGSNPEWMTLTFPAGTKAFGMYLAPDACATGSMMSVVIDFEANVALKNMAYRWYHIANMPLCENGDSRRPTTVGSYVGMYVLDPAFDSIPQLKIRVPKFDDGTSVPLLFGDLEISTYSLLQDRFVNPSGAAAAAMSVEAITKKTKENAATSAATAARKGSAPITVKASILGFRAAVPARAATATSDNNAIPDMKETTENKASEVPATSTAAVATATNAEDKASVAPASDATAATAQAGAGTALADDKASLPPAGTADAAGNL